MSKYQVSELNGCKVIRGAVPVLDLAALLSAWDSGWIMDGALAKALGVSVVVGSPENTAAWRAQLGLTQGKA